MEKTLYNIKEIKNEDLIPYLIYIKFDGTIERTWIEQLMENPNIVLFFIDFNLI